MKQFKLTLVLTVLMSMVGLQAFAYWDTSTKVHVGAFYYYLDHNSHIAQVTEPSATYEYTGNITIPSSITYNDTNYSVIWIGEHAFMNCSGLTSVTIPNSVTEIRNQAFMNCSGLTSVSIPNSVTNILNQAFQGCSGLTKVIISDIAAWCGISIESSPLSLAHHLYSDENTEITELVIPEGVTSIGNNAFNDCDGFTSLTIPNSVTSIGQYAFNDCDGFTSLTIPNNVTSIGQYAFNGCDGLTSLTIPNSVTSIGQYAFNNCSGLASINVESGNSFFDSRNNCNAIIITASNTLITGCKNTVIPNSVTSIYEGAFHNCTGLTSVTIPNSVTSVTNVFQNCSSLTSVTINSNAICSAKYYYQSGIENLFGSQVEEYIIGDDVTSIGGAAFEDCSSLTSVTIGNNVTSIGSSAFYGCSGLTSITIPNSVTSIGGYAFTSCSGLTSVTIPNSVTSIGDCTFQYCTGLTSVTIPNSVTSIGRCAFIGCSKLTSVTIPNSVTSIGNEAFKYCTGLTSVTIPNSVTSIGDDAFSDCNGLTKVIVSDIAAWCGISFSNSSSNPITYASHLYSDENTEITNLVIPNGVTSIGQYVFYGCDDITSVTIPNSVTSIGDMAFCGCSGLTSVTVDINSPLTITGYTFFNRTNATLYVPAGSKSAYEAADYWKDFKEIVEMGDPTNIVFADANVKAICVAHWDTNNDGELSYDEAAAVTTISDYFKNNTSITSFDEFAYFTGVTSIDDWAFNGCSGLTSIAIPNSVTSIGHAAFADCSSLTSITIPNSVTSIELSAFVNCSSLTSIAIPNSVTSIGVNAFANCSGLTSISVDTGNTKYDSRNNCNAIIITSSNTLVCGCINTVIPNSVTSIDNTAFCGRSSLTSITIPESVTYIGYCAFADCSSLTSITIPESVTSIGNQAFNGCSGLTSIIIPSNVTSIGTWAFEGCSGLTSVTIPNSVTSIGHAAFADCSSLTSITIPNSVTSIDRYAFSGCTGLTSIAIPNSVTSIGEGTFEGCSGLTSISIPNSVTSIGYRAFADCSSLITITIPSSVTSIPYAEIFDGCSALTSIKVKHVTPLDINFSTLSYLYSRATLYVPAGSKSAYEAANYWREFKEIVEGDPASVTIAMNAGTNKPRSMVGYSSEYGLDFTGITGIRAYIVCGFNFKKEAMLVHVDVVPPYTGIVIKTTNSSYDGEEFVVPTSTDDYYYANLLLPVVESQTVQPTETIDDVEYTNLMVGILNNEQPGFVRLTDPVVRQNKSYLRIPTSLYNSSASARQLGGISMVFEDDEATGISNLNDNVNDNVDANAPRYNIAGQRVDAGYKGVVIQNGKKILIK